MTAAAVGGAVPAVTLLHCIDRFQWIVISVVSPPGWAASLRATPHHHAPAGWAVRADSHYPTLRRQERRLAGGPRRPDRHYHGQGSPGGRTLRCVDRIQWIAVSPPGWAASLRATPHYRAPAGRARGPNPTSLRRVAGIGASPAGLDGPIVATAGRAVPVAAPPRCIDRIPPTVVSPPSWAAAWRIRMAHCSSAAAASATIASTSRWRSPGRRLTATIT